MNKKKPASFDSDDSDSEDKDIDKAISETKGWNVFREMPLKEESGSMITISWIETSVKFMKVLVYFFTFVLVLGSAVISKGILLFITSQLKKDRQIIHCNRLLGLDKQFVTYLDIKERVAWLWCLICVFGISEVGKFIRSARITFFKSVSSPTACQSIIIFITESLHSIGTAILLLFILPELDVVKGAMLTNCFCFIPALLNLLSRSSSDENFVTKLILDIFALSCQLTGFIVWPLFTGQPQLWLIPIACTFISIGWWENFADRSSDIRILRRLAKMKESLKACRSKLYIIVTPLNILWFLIASVIHLWLNDDSPLSLFTSVQEAFSMRTYVVEEIQVTIDNLSTGALNTSASGTVFEIENHPSTPLYVFLIQAISAYCCYIVGKFACRILIQPFSFALPLSLAVPVTINLLIVFCGLRNSNPCYFHEFIPDYLFFDMPPVYYLNEFVRKDLTWIWLLWLASQLWITLHIWLPKCERLASTDKLFALPLYSGVHIDQSLILNRTKDEEIDIKLEDLSDTQYTSKPGSSQYYDNSSVGTDGSIFGVKNIKSSDHLTRIYICATMWHETKDEIMEFLKSIFRLDEDQCARRVAQKYLRIADPDYYEMESHIYMDDAFEVSDHSGEDFQVNRFARLLVETIDQAASEVHLTKITLRPPKKYPTPYGGKLVWTLPGKTKLICHLKDKLKIRHRKRWSQVMYMYYLLGHRLMDLPISVERKEVIAENTYLLALDGDIDFQPKAVHILIDLMKKNKNLGAACGRIHPVGSGPMAWYQIFEYAIGHWMQKATEHVIGCVLCSPGCFSLFRGKALMDDNVMRKYTMKSHEARHYVQYDQGEDRWLCTLLLQRGYKVEYSAASDAYTHCPEGFNEFYNQRRRWVPSTMANIFDLLMSAKRTIAINDNISRIYIAYQILLMVGSILAPGTIFLMVIGAINAAFGVSYMIAFQINFYPVAIFLAVCLTCKSEIQLFLAGAITCFYGLTMVAVVVGIALQISEDGWLAPSSLFMVLTFGSFVVTALLHPQEIHCLFYLLVYYITIPSMYMLLIFYSLCNLNNVTWGTREVAQKKTAKELEMEATMAKPPPGKLNGFFGSLWNKKMSDDEGSLECSCAGLFKVMCCVHPKANNDNTQFTQILRTIESLERKIDGTNGANNGTNETVRQRHSINLRTDARLSILTEYSESMSEISEEIPMQEDRDDLSNPFWIEDPALKKGEVDFLSTAEISFWKDLIDAYLRPLEMNEEEQERIAKDLKELRNRSVFAFVMINTIFVMVVFLLQINQEAIHIVWPWGAKVTISYDSDENTVVLEQEFLQLEPIGMVFVVFFAGVLIIQFVAMLFHRMGTFTHLLSTVQLNWFCYRRAEFNEDGLLERHAVDIVKNLQKLNDDDGEDSKETVIESDVTRRKTVHNLEKARQTKLNITNLDAAFKKRFFNLTSDDTAKISIGGAKQLSLRRETLRALETRRNSFIAEKRKSQMMMRRSTSKGLYSSESGRYDNGLFKYGDPSNGFMNAAYEPAFDDEDDDIETPRLGRKSVGFA